MAANTRLMYHLTQERASHAAPANLYHVKREQTNFLTYRRRLPFRS